MENYCKCCEYKTTLAANFKKHLESKKHKHVSMKLAEVSPKLAQISPKLAEVSPKLYFCKYCEQPFKHKSSLSKHIKYSCKNNTDEDLKELVRLMNLQLETHRNQLQAQNKKIESQARQIEKLVGKLEINGSFNTTVNNFNLLSYRETDVSHLTDEDYRGCIKKVNHCVKTLIDKVHFNKLKPENMNLYISNMKDKYMTIYDGNNWTLVNRKEELDRLYEEKEMMLEEWLETNPDPVLKDKFIKYLNNKEDDECLNQIKEDLKLMVYNKTKELSLGT